jgi:Mg2+ and Co2+ transporter CorA
MTDKNIQDVAAEMKAHERECQVYRETTQRSLDNLESRIKRLELLIMASTMTILGSVFLLLSKGL